MQAIVGIIIAFGILLFATTFFAIFFNLKSYKNLTMIARQTGSAIDDVMWISDKFRVRNKNGFWIIQFKNLKEKTSSVPGSFWTKMIAKKYQKKVLQFKEEDWKGKDISRLIRRGIMFYETNEGEFHPMTIEKKDDHVSLHVISQDNRQFLINEIKDINSLTKNRFKEMLLLGGIVLAIFVLAVIFIIGIIYLSEEAKAANVAGTQACIDYYHAIQNISTTDTGSAPFLDRATNILVQQ